MNRDISDILNHINQGIIITNEKSEIVFINEHMTKAIDFEDKNFINTKIYESIPSLNKTYFKDAMKAVIENDNKFFFSSAMHSGLLCEDLDFNFKLTRFEYEESRYVIIECTDVTSQVKRINQYKEYNVQLQSLNKTLKEKEKEIEKLAYYDGLTGLANRTFFYKLANQIINDADRNKKEVGLMFIDIDKFKDINDKYGHMIGDKVLVEVAKLLVESKRKNDVISRHGGDEFLILLPDIKDHDNHRLIASRISKANRSVNLNGIEINISLSIGISFYPKDGGNIDQLISNADKAMYKAKELGGNKCAAYGAN